MNVPDSFHIVWFHEENGDLAGALVSDSQQACGIIIPITEVTWKDLISSDTSANYMNNATFRDLRQSLDSDTGDCTV